jgi:hypothetical protein
VREGIVAIDLEVLRRERQLVLWISLDQSLLKDGREQDATRISSLRHQGGCGGQNAEKAEPEGGEERERNVGLLGPAGSGTARIQGRRRTSRKEALQLQALTPSDGRRWPFREARPVLPLDKR